MDAEEYEALKDDIQKNGYREDLPIIIYNGGIIDGWNRYRACKDLGVTPKVKMFRGNDQEAIEYIMSSNKRRNLTSSQRAAIAVEAEAVVKAIEEQVEKERRAKQAENYKNQYSQYESGFTELIPPTQNRGESKKEAAEARTKIAEAFGTNPRYISDAKRLKEENPEAFEKIKRGETTITKIKKEQKKKQREQRKEIAKSVFVETVAEIEAPKAELNTWVKLGNHFLYCGDNRDEIFINALPKAKFAFSDPPYNENVMDWDTGFRWQQDYLQDFAEIVAVTPGISQIPFFIENTKMSYKWSCAAWITNGMTRGALGFGNWIYIALFSKLESIHRNKQDFYKVNISNKVDDLHTHRGRKPEELLVNLIGDFTNEGDVVIDNFLGSGTTLFCCQEMNRVCYGAESDLKFCQDIIDKFYYKYGKDIV